MSARENYLEARVSDLSHALESAITTLEYVGNAELIVEQLRRVLREESGVATARSHSDGRQAASELAGDYIAQWKGEK